MNTTSGASAAAETKPLNDFITSDTNNNNSYSTIISNSNSNINQDCGGLPRGRAAHTRLIVYAQRRAKLGCAAPLSDLRDPMGGPLQKRARTSYPHDGNLDRCHTVGGTALGVTPVSNNDQQQVWECLTRNIHPKSREVFCTEAACIYVITQIKIS